MTPIFFLLAAIAVTVAIFFILLPLVRGANPERARIERQIEALDDLIDELDPKEYATRRKALRARLDSVGGQRKVGVGMMVALALIIPIGTVFLYTQVGEPEGLYRIDAPVTDLRDELIRISNSIARNPDNPEYWTRIAIAYKNMREFGAAAHAFRRALYVDEDNPFVKVELAETLMFMNQRPGMPAESRELLAEALTIDPDHQKGLWLMGIGASQDGNYQRAIAFWERLLPQLDPGSSVYNSIVGQIGQARLALGQDPGELPPTRPAPPLRDDQTELPPGHPPMAEGAPRIAGPITPDAVLPPGHPQSPTTARPGPVDPSAPLPPGHPPMDSGTRTAGPLAPGATLPPSHPPMDAPAAASADEGPAPTFSVELNIAPALAAELNGDETVFVVARAAGGPPTPLAVRRMTVADLPTRIGLSDSDAMVEGMNLSTFPEIVITARVSKNGGVDARPGDLQGQTEPVSVLEMAGTRLTISERL
ncbi:MAG: c-type cytochrome biogenesis protein CcmI/CycH [Wenzhouxiangella sp.]